MLAQHRLEQHQNQSVVFPWDETETYKVKGHGIVEHQLHVMKELAWKHALEREVCISLSLLDACINFGFPRL